jgi:hypothetical protein
VDGEITFHRHHYHIYFNIRCCCTCLFVDTDYLGFKLDITFFLYFRRHVSKIMPNILSAIGCTPMVEMNNIPKSFGIQCKMRKYIFRF